MKNSRILLVAASVAVGTFGMSQGVTLAQDAAKQQQAEQQRQEKEAKQAERQARKAEKAEKEQLQNMPKVVRETLTAQVGQGTGVDYYKLADGEQKVFGATFKDAAGETVDVRVDREGKVLSRLSGADAATAAAQQPAPTPAAPGAPAPAAPATPAGPTYNPTDLSAAARAHQAHRLDQIPAGPQAVLREETKTAANPAATNYFRGINGQQEVWEAKFTTADGKDMVVHVNDAGQVVERRQITDAEEKKRTEVKFDSMPDNVKDQLRQVTRGQEGAQFYQNTWNGQPVYETMYWDKDQRWVVRLDASGKEVDRRVLKDAKRVSDYDKKKDDGDNKKKDRKDDDRK